MSSMTTKEPTNNRDSLGYISISADAFSRNCKNLVKPIREVLSYKTTTSKRHQKWNRKLSTIFLLLLNNLVYSLSLSLSILLSLNRFKAGNDLEEVVK